MNAIHNENKENMKEQWFREAIRASGLYQLTHVSYPITYHNMLSALVERWHDETSSFHIYIGEMKVTLDDMFCLLHLSH